LDDSNKHRDDRKNEQDVNDHANIPNREAKQPSDKKKNKYGPKHGRFLFFVNSLKVRNPFMERERQNGEDREHEQWLEERSRNQYRCSRLPQCRKNVDDDTKHNGIGGTITIPKKDVGNSSELSQFVTLR
jgi:hypothetical protein